MTPDTTDQPRTATVTLPGERDVHVERIFDAPRELVYRTFTDPELIPQWWGMGAVRVDEMDVRPGGKWRFVAVGEDGSEQAFRGVFREVHPPESVVQTFEWEGMPGHISVDTMHLEDLGDGRTKFVGTSLFMTAEDRDGMVSSGMERGMNVSHQRLDALLATLQSE